MRAARPLLAGALTLATAFTGLALAPGAAAAPTTRYVAKTGTDTENDCSVETRPCLTVRWAQQNAAGGDTVSIGAGTYRESISLYDKDLTLAGDPNGKTVISGDPEDSVNPTIIAFGAFGTDFDPNNLRTITLRDLDISGNSTQAGVVAAGVELVVERSHLDRNTSAGLLAFASVVNVADSTVSANRASTGGGAVDESAAGAGIATVRAAVSLTNTTVAGNAGAGVVQGVVPQVGDRAARAALPTAASTVISRSTVSGNGVGGVVVNSGLATIGSSTVSGNDLGGVVALNQAGISISASTIAGTTNTEDIDDAAGIVNATSPAEDVQVRKAFGLSSATAASRLLEKTAADVGSTVLRRAAGRVAAAAPAAAAGVVTVQSSAVIAQGAGATDCIDTVADGGYNASSDATNSCRFSAAKNDLVKIAPKVGPLADNGGPTRTHLPLVGSPLINKVPATVSGDADQRGVARPQDVRSDIGAVEAKLAPVRITTKSLPDGQVGDEYNKQLAATGGDGDYAWSLAKGSSLPDGLRLSPAGVISGTPTESGKFRFTVLADGASKRFTLVIDESGAAPNGDGQDPIAETGAASASLMAWGSALLLAGFAVMLFAGYVGRRPGRHRT